MDEVQTLRAALEVENEELTPQLSTLCPACRAIFNRWQDRGNWFAVASEHSHHKIEGLIDSAKRGCPVCDLFLQGLSPVIIQQLLKDRPDFRSLIEVVLDGEAGEEMFEIKVRFYSQNASHKDLGLQKHQLKTKVSAFRSLTSSTEIGRIQEFTDSKENWELVKGWLDLCRNTHTECSKSLFNRELPTRLIEVGQNDACLKLCQTGSLPSETSYMTLSHCWGGKVFTKLLRNNLDEFLIRIPTNDFSKTFREAVATTRNLGIQYLWIDSLCIIQDDSADWQQEASKMGSVYSNSTLNIAAADAPDGDSGCFTTRISDQVHGCKVVGMEGQSKNAVWDVVQESFFYMASDSVLFSRAWVYQEVFLAPRTLYFHAEQLKFECAEAKASEMFPGWYDDGIKAYPAAKLDLWQYPDIRVAFKWASMLVEYGYRKVSFHSDRLIAIAGISRIFASKLGTTYLAGLWKEELVPQLLWHTSALSSADYTDSVPSWSWAAVDSTFGYRLSVISADFDSLVTIIEASTVVVDDTFGHTIGGSIFMQSPLPIMATALEELIKGFWHVELKASRPICIRIDPDRKEYIAGDEIYLLPLISATDRFDLNSKYMFGLIIECVLPNSYRRTGSFYLQGKSEMDDFQNIKEAQKQAKYSDKFFVGKPMGVDDSGQNTCILTLI